MMRMMLKSKIYYASITETRLYYKGSIGIDERIIEEADLKAGEKVEVLNINNGIRLETYIIKEEKDSGIISLRGPAARMGYKGDKIIILSYGLYSERELEDLKTKFVELDEKNRVKNTYMA